MVTGAAQGLGLAMSEALAREGAKVLMTDINETVGAAAASRLLLAGLDVAFIRHDATSPDDWKRVMEIALSHDGRLDVLVNNAGGGLDKNIEELDYAHFRRMIALNLDSAFLGTQSGIAAMKANGGSIINISSIGGIIGTAALPSYSAGKAGVRLLTKCAAIHCGQRGYGIRVNSVHPGLIKTAAGVEVTKMATGLDEADAVAAFASLHPIGRFGEPAEIAAGVVFLASDESSFMTGSELTIDGGYTAQ
jgi:NAD(P)-dependent dehydrogenase (short-subunit alcohol dehydrogenase family)